MRVLVADDEAAMTRALEALLKREHYSVDVDQQRAGRAGTMALRKIMMRWYWTS